MFLAPPQADSDGESDGSDRVPVPSFQNSFSQAFEQALSQLDHGNPTPTQALPIPGEKKIHIKGDNLPKNLNCHLLTLKLFQNCMNFFLLLNTKDIFKNLGNQTVNGPHWLPFYLFFSPYGGVHELIIIIFLLYKWTLWN